MVNHMNRWNSLSLYCTWCRGKLRDERAKGLTCGRSKALKNGCTRSYLILLNFMFLVGGASVLSLGFYMHIDRQTTVYVDLLHSIPTSGLLLGEVDISCTSGLLALFEKLPAVFIIIGGSVAILSFLGCCGACADSACFLSLYILLLCFILITEIVITSVITIFRERILLKLELALQHQIRYEYNKTGRHNNFTNYDTDHVTIVLDLIQVKMNCCGGAGPEDYKHSAWFNRTRPLEEVFVPPSCCVPRTVGTMDALGSSPVSGQQQQQQQQPRSRTTTGVASASARLLGVVPADENQCQLESILYPQKDRPTTSLKTQGCRRSLVIWFNSNVAVIVGVVFFVVLVQILDMLSACTLLAWVRQKHSECDSNDEGEFG